MSNAAATINQAGITVGEPAIIRQEGVFTELQVEKVTKTQFTAGGFRFHNSGAPVGDTRDAQGAPITAATASAHGTSWHWASWPMFSAMADAGLTVEGPVANITYSLHTIRDPFLGELGTINTHSFQLETVAPNGQAAYFLTWAEAVAFLQADTVARDQIKLEGRVAIYRQEVTKAEQAVASAEELHADRVKRQLGVESSREGLGYAQRSLVRIQESLAGAIQELATWLDDHNVVLEDPQDVRWILQDQAKEDQEREAAEELEHADQLAVLELSGADVIPAGTALERHSHVEVHPLVAVPIPDTSWWNTAEPTADMPPRQRAGLEATQNPLASLSPERSEEEDQKTIQAAQALQEATRARHAEQDPETVEELESKLASADRLLENARTRGEDPRPLGEVRNAIRDRLTQAKNLQVIRAAEDMIADLPVWLQEPTEDKPRRVWMAERELVDARRRVTICARNVAGLPERTTENGYGQDTVRGHHLAAIRDLDHPMTHLKNAREALDSWRAKAPETPEELEAYVQVCEELAEAATQKWMDTPQGPELAAAYAEEQEAVRRWGQAFRTLQHAKRQERTERKERVGKLARRYRAHLPQAPQV